MERESSLFASIKAPSEQAENEIVKITQASDRVREDWTFEGTAIKGRASYSFAVDGSEQPITRGEQSVRTPISVRAEWQNCTLIVHEKMLVHSLVVEFKNTYVLSERGKRLTIFQEAHRGVIDSERRLVFQRAKGRTMQSMKIAEFGLAAMVALMTAAASPPGQTPPVAGVTGGLIQGAFEPSSAKGAVFKGIPFAQPPVGDLRWREPQPVRPWKGIRDATRYGAACVQNPMGLAVFLQPLAKLYGAAYDGRKVAMSEDCLYLNMWTPEWPLKNPVPVMVWIHGGSNVMGSGAEASYDGAALARKGVVVVTINYRLGALASFAHPELTRESPHHASGNYGLLDQIAALEWVQRNIAAFGGDPKRVTVFGESAGAIDAGLLLCSPLAAGLLQRAIMESGPVLSTAHHPSSLEAGERFGESVARSLGAADLKKLRTAPPDAIIRAYAEVAARQTDPGFVLDGWCLRSAPADVFARGEQLPVDMLIGNNGREMSAFRAKAGKSESKSVGDPEALKKAVRIFYAGATPVVIGMVLIDSALGRTQAVDLWLNEVIADCPAMAMAALQAETGHQAYVYQFLRSIPGMGEKTLGSFHGLEVPYVFGAFRQPDWSWLPFEPVDFALGETIQKYWTNFAKTGNPNGADLPHWPNFVARSQTAMQFGKQGGVSANKRARPTFCEVAPGPLRTRLIESGGKTK
jgi:para-nitrobenzyl esterase